MSELTVLDIFRYSPRRFSDACYCDSDCIMEVTLDSILFAGGYDLSAEGSISIATDLTYESRYTNEEMNCYE